MSVEVDYNSHGVPRVWPTGDNHCDGCPKGYARMKLTAKAGEGYTARTMRLCAACALDMYHELLAEL